MARQDAAIEYIEYSRASSPATAIELAAALADGLFVRACRPPHDARHDRAPNSLLRTHARRAGDSNDLVVLAKMSRTNGGTSLTADYIDRALEAARGAGRALDRMVPLLPQQ